MRWIVFLTLISNLLWISCAEETVEVPPTVLPRDSMAMILKDMHLIEGWVTYKRGMINPDSINPAPYYKWMFEKNNISEAYYRNSFDYYTSHPELLLEVYDKVLEELSQHEAKVDAGSLSDTTLQRSK